MKKREFQSSPKGTVETAHGEFKVTVNGTKSLYVETPDGGVDVRGVPIRATEHWHLNDDGKWTGYYERPDIRYGFKAQRLDRGQFVHEEATATQTRVVYEAMRTAAGTFAAANPATLLRGEVVSANNDIERVDKEIAKLQEQLGVLLATRGEHLDRENAAQAELDGMEEAPAPGLR